ncbi:MAG: hypothetical protein AMS25_03820 [Gemmatimonas sp. SM23_52]|nr:MAG: hypothetical protein AMS25_03820 [Gemmatimonas sp. SM23_52]
MALIRCPHCNSEVSDAAQFCPSCEWPLKAERSRRRFVRVFAVLFIIAALYASYDIWRSAEGSIVDTLFQGETLTAVLVGLLVLVWFVALTAQIWANSILRRQYPDVWKKHFVSKRILWPNEYCDLGSRRLATLVRVHRASILIFGGLMLIAMFAWA